MDRMKAPGGSAVAEKAEKKKTRRRSRIIKILAVVVLLLLAAELFASNYLVTFAIRRSSASGASVAPEPVTTSETENAVMASVQALQDATEDWYAQAERETVTLTARDGLALVGDVFPNEDSHRWLIAVHGYTGRRQHMYHYARAYAERGYSVLTPDMRAHGDSQGEYIGMGWLDRLDILDWIGWILERDPEAEIVLHGVSMGGATVLMTAGEDLPENVKAIVDDCGYTSVWDIFSDELKYLFHLPDFPFLYTASGFAKLRAGYSFQEASALEQVKRTTVPVLFIHGDQDNFVHTDMVYRLYEACPTEKALYVAEGAGHGQSLYVDPPVYFETVFSFLDRVSPAAGN